MTSFAIVGEMTEWSNVSDSKSDVPLGTGGSNPSLSATEKTRRGGGFLLKTDCRKLTFELAVGGRATERSSVFRLLDPPFGITAGNPSLSVIKPYYDAY